MFITDRQSFFRVHHAEGRGTSEWDDFLKVLVVAISKPWYFSGIGLSSCRSRSSGVSWTDGLRRNPNDEQCKGQEWATVSIHYLFSRSPVLPTKLTSIWIGSVFIGIPHSSAWRWSLHSWSRLLDGFLSRASERSNSTSFSWFACRSGFSCSWSSTNWTRQTVWQSFCWSWRIDCCDGVDLLLDWLHEDKGKLSISL